jgi:glutamine amidotransferase
MGWNQVDQHIDHPLWQGIENNSRFYFVHSFYVEESDSEYVAGFTNYGVSFTAAISHQNVFATQFHPEKSDVNGLQLLKNFIAWDGTV